MEAKKKTRKELRGEIKKEVESYKLKQKNRKTQVMELSEEKRKEALVKDKQLEKEAKKKRKAEIKNMEKSDRKAAKKHDKIFRKIKNQTRRRIIKGAVLVAVFCLIIYVFPMGNDVYNMLTGKGMEIDIDGPGAAEAREIGHKVAAKIPEEGIVLLKNEDNILPLKEKKVNVFGLSSYNILYGGFGSGAADYSNAVSLIDGLKNAGIEYNEELKELYENFATDDAQNKSGALQILTKKDSDEPDIGYLSDEIIAGAKDYSENVIIVVSSTASEAMDFSPENLRLTKNREDLIKKISENFKNIIIIINSGNVMELGFLEEYPSIKGAIWTGYPGAYGCNSLGKILTGEINPSGRLVDTYAYDNESAPSTVSFGHNPYSNLEGETFINYNEGIYVGYRFYETYYLGDEAGYNKAVQFPFGYGLSYSDFKWEMSDSSITNEKVSVIIEVKNEGEVAGKDVVQLYFTPPYTDGGIEKAAIELGGYKKTEVISPGESEIVKIEFDAREMASYDTENEQYILEAGEYEFKIAKNVHDIVQIIKYEVKSDIIYKTDEVTEEEYKNRFDEAKGEITYLSRSDFEGTYPKKEDINYVAPDYLIEGIEVKYEKSELEMPTLKVDNGIILKDLQGLDYDDPMWDSFLDQFTRDEMKELVIKGAYKTIPIERLGIPKTTLLDGPAGISFFFGSYPTVAYPTEILLASTWNEDIAREMGEAVGKEAKAYGVNGWYAPAMNIHRTPQGGRNFEYFSEDPLLSGKMSVGITQGAQSQDVIVFMKHFAINDQETNARDGIVTWLNEQSMREIYLRPFEMTVKEGGAYGAMSSFPRIGPTWAGGNKGLLTEILRNEWGFEGVVSSDATMRLWPFMNIYEGITSGNDLMLDIIPTMNRRYLNKNYKKDPVGITIGLRNSVHNICFAITKTSALDD